MITGEMAASGFKPTEEQKKQGVKDLLYEMEQMISVAEKLPDAPQLRLGEECALLESLLVHVRNLHEVFSTRKRRDPLDGPDKTILCKDYSFPSKNCLSQEMVKRVNDYLFHVRYGREDSQSWHIGAFRGVFKQAAEFLTHLEEDIYPDGALGRKMAQRMSCAKQKLGSLMAAEYSQATAWTSVSEPSVEDASFRV